MLCPTSQSISILAPGLPIHLVRAARDTVRANHWLQRSTQGAIAISGLVPVPSSATSTSSVPVTTSRKAALPPAPCRTYP